ncbi:glycosyltransferase family 2 protein [Roseovarius sp. MMSF_3281]|uniref:glycosyltransferase n=1 Tax=Roseovarius sp. MMSF_3281 TaxID=3046694 RepID=UPI00273D5FF6|nr:glycosyltransferase [Roseovarius sp. MMSF_3281]
MSLGRLAIVIIGRNEGARFLACLDALPKGVGQVIYVDSGSTDGSIEAARDYGAEVVDLDRDQPFTAARARNAGVARIEGAELVQFLDGDCTLRAGWIDTGLARLQDDEGLAVVCGRRRERFPGASVFNRLCDAEWDTPVGPALACGGDAMMRVEALRAVDGYNGDLIAGEEPELCVRLRAAGWRIERLDAEMTWHDAAMTRFGQWWKRSKRAGHAFAEGAALHGAPPERHWLRETRRALLWGAVLPLVILGALLVSPWLALVLALAYPAQVVRLALRDRDWARAFFNVLGKFAEAQGALGYYLSRLRGRKQGLVEYK